MANVDNQLLVWVNDRLLDFSSSTAYSRPVPDAPYWSPTDPGDTQPAAIGAEGADLEVSDMRLLRDIYYIAINAKTSASGFDDDLFSMGPRHTEWKNPRAWIGRRGNFSPGAAVTYVLGEKAALPHGRQQSSQRRRSTVVGPDSYRHGGQAPQNAPLCCG